MPRRLFGQATGEEPPGPVAAATDPSIPIDDGTKASPTELASREVGDANPGVARRGVDQSERSWWIRLANFASVAGIALFVTALVILHGLRGDLNPYRHSISEYSIGKYGWLMRSAFFALGVGAVATAAALRFRLEPNARRRIGMLLLTATAIGFFVDAAFNTDHLGVQETFDGAIHGDGTLIICLTLPAVAYIFGSDFIHSSLAIRRARWLRILGPLQVIAILAFQFGPMAYHGLIERIAVAIGIVNLILLYSIARAPSERWWRRPLRLQGRERPSVGDEIESGGQTALPTGISGQGDLGPDVGLSAARAMVTTPTYLRPVSHHPAVPHTRLQRRP